MSIRMNWTSIALVTLMAMAPRMALAQCAGLDNSSGCYKAIHESYVILGTTTNLANVTEVIDYRVDTGLGLGAANTEDINALSTSQEADGYTAMSSDADAISFVSNGTIGLRANDSFDLLFTVPMLKAGSTSCVPVFSAENQSDVGVTANFTISVFDIGEVTPIASYSVDNSFAGVGTPSTIGTVDVTCPSSTLGAGTIKISVVTSETLEMEIGVDIGFEIDGSKSVSGSSFVAVGADGEPAADTYELELGLSASIPT